MGFYGPSNIRLGDACKQIVILDVKKSAYGSKNLGIACYDHTKGLQGFGALEDRRGVQSLQYDIEDRTKEDSQYVSAP